MSQSTWTRVDLFARSLSPVALTVLVVMISMVPLGIPGFSPVAPLVGLIAVYYWIAHRPDLMPAWTIFMIGLLQDLLSGGRLGVSVFVLLIVFAVVAGQRRVFAAASFMKLWLIFLPVAAGAFLLSWLFNSLIADALMDLRPVAFQYLTTVAFYPCLAWAFVQAQRAFLR